MKAAEFHARGCSVNPEDLLQTVLEKVLSGERSCPVEVRIVVTLDNAMRSLANNERKKAQRAPIAALDDDFDEKHAESADSPEEVEMREQEAERQRTTVLALFQQDPVAYRVVLLMLDGRKGADLRRQLAGDPTGARPQTHLDERQFAAIRRRIRRRIERASKEGLL